MLDVCLSDLHFGEEDSLLTNLRGGSTDIDPAKSRLREYSVKLRWLCTTAKQSNYFIAGYSNWLTVPGATESFSTTVAESVRYLDAESAMQDQEGGLALWRYIFSEKINN